MNNTKLNCSLNDTKELKEMIVNNPDLPLIFFCGEDCWDGDYSYQMGDVTSCEIEELTLYNETWMNEEDYGNRLYDYYAEDCKDMTDQAYDEFIDNKVANTEFIKAIVVYLD